MKPPHPYADSLEAVVAAFREIDILPPSSQIEWLREVQHMINQKMADLNQPPDEWV